ncbi:MAG: hypothetical protein ACK42L_02970 [Thermoanaerobaculum sp.]
MRHAGARSQRHRGFGPGASQTGLHAEGQFAVFISQGLSSGFAFVWKMLERSAHSKAPLLILAAVVGLVGLLAMGGWKMVTDRVLAAITVWPVSLAVAQSVLPGEAGRKDKTQDSRKRKPPRANGHWVAFALVRRLVATGGDLKKAKPRATPVLHKRGVPLWQSFNTACCTHKLERGGVWQ